MPTYDYKCKDCSYKFEIKESIKSEPLKECPKCKGEIKRLIGTGAGFIFLRDNNQAVVDSMIQDGTLQYSDLKV